MSFWRRGREIGNLGENMKGRNLTFEETALATLSALDDAGIKIKSWVSSYCPKPMSAPGPYRKYVKTINLPMPKKHETVAPYTFDVDINIPKSITKKLTIRFEPFRNITYTWHGEDENLYKISAERDFFYLGFEAWPRNWF